MPKSRGFTLVELMMVVTVIAILAAIAIPSYSSYTSKARRADAAQLLLDIQNKEEQYVLDARVYTTALTSAGGGIPMASANGWTCAGTTCTNTFYSVAVTLVTGPPPSYNVVATALSSQASDGDLTLSSAGAKTRSAGDGKW